jgi:hypothetical protein
MNNILRNKEFKCGLEKSQAMPKIASAPNADSNFPFKNSLKILGLATN